MRVLYRINQYDDEVRDEVEGSIRRILIHGDANH